MTLPQPSEPPPLALGWVANSVPRGHTRQHEESSKVDPWDPEVTLTQANSEYYCYDVVPNHGDAPYRHVLGVE
jgi:hypothetical protein